MVVDRRLSFDDIIKAEVQKALDAAPKADGGGSFNLNMITKLLAEVNKLAATQRVYQGGGDPPVPSPPPAPAPVVKKQRDLDPEKIYGALLRGMGQLRAVVGDVPISQVEKFMSENKAVVLPILETAIRDFK
jgi:hypothetical protein